MDFKIVLPSIYINFDIQTKFEVNQTQIGHSPTIYMVAMAWLLRTNLWQGLELSSKLFHLQVDQAEIFRWWRIPGNLIIIP